uniref:Tyrosine-protein kinase ephrin type A/B receptor-like domain-containing protein n=1 Tax=viral metagenome TaxID=1070528 RepID=A0A6C0M185_9ZZZZ
MLFNVILLCNMFNYVLSNNISYLFNNKSNFKYLTLPESNLINKNPRIHPFVGFGCNEYNKNDNLNYLVTSSYHPNFGYSTQENYKCSYTKKYVEILKYNSTNNSNTNTLLIGENTNNYPDAIGGEGNDNIISCGIDTELDILYYITSNKYNCHENYKSDSSIVRINLTDFSFIDRTLFKNFNNKEPFSTSSYYEYKYLNAPSCNVLLEGDSLWIGFGTVYGGIWKLNISTTPIELLEQFQKSYMMRYENEFYMDDNSIQEYKTYIREIKRCFIIEELQKIYFIEDTGYNDAKVLIINYTQPLNDNTTSIKTLDGLNYISDIKLDTKNKNIYIITGSLNSELYKLDYTFNKQPLNTNCDIDFLKFPPEWGVITNIQIDTNTGYIYAIKSLRHQYNGIVRINMKDMTIDMDTEEFFKILIQYNQYSHYQYLQNTNISSMNLNDGKLYLVGNSQSWHSYLIEYDLFGCSKGRGFLNNTCNICLPGKFSNAVGGICIDCTSGYANENYESTFCDKCEKGKFTTGSHTIYCLDCPQGYYIELEGYDNCNSCQKGKYSITSASDTKDDCLNCDDGKISDVGEVSCDFCEIGKWAKNRVECISCSKGKFSNSLGLINDDECELCPIGKFNDELGLSNELDCKICENGKIGIVEGVHSNTSCVLCEVGKYKETLKSCEICPNGWVSNNIENKCDQCDTGKWALDKKQCIDCPKGTYSFNIGLTSSDECISCDIGKYQSNTGQITVNSCKTCENGKIGIIEGAYSKKYCVSCEVGKYKETLKSCEICPDGWISNNIENKCDQCDSGKWALDKKQCIDCPRGTYSFNTGLTSSDECVACSIGKYQTLISQITESSCETCENGKIGIIQGAHSNTSCVLCGVGKYKETLKSCEICPDGWISNNIENKCDQCDSGKWALDKKQCANCPKGTYSFNIGLISSDECILCEIGKYQPLKGQITENSCKTCENGKIGIIEGAHLNTSCVLCETGKYKNTLKSCVICPDGWISILERYDCDICPEGKYSNTYKNFCELCPIGRFNDKVGKNNINQCLNCGRGTWSNKIGQTTAMGCIGCNPGYYGDEIGMISLGSCKKCPAGLFNENAGLPSVNDCKECSTGRYSIDGSIYCLPCETGKYNIQTGSPNCLECPEGKFTANISSYICKNCPVNSEQNSNKTDCVCSTNKYNTNYNNDLNCIDCNNTFTCKIDTNIKTINIKKHYWRYSDLAIDIYKCKTRFACKGGIIKNSSDDLCNEGFKGPLCNVCEKGWAKDDGVCLKCPEDKGRTISLTIIIPIVSVIIIIFLIKTANPANNKKEEVNGVVKIFMNYAQVFSLASSFQINWPTLIRYLFERAKEFSSPRVSFYSSDCAIGWSYYDKLLVYLILPLFYIIGVTIFIFFISLCYCKRKKAKIKRMRTVKSQIELEAYEKNNPSCFKFFIAWEKTAIVVGTFLSWPTIVTKTLEVLNCEKIGEQYYLVKDYSVICYDSKHYTYLTVAYVSLILYGLGIPLLGFKLLYNYRYRLYDMQNRYDGSTPLSFLFLGYRENRWYYEFIIMGKKAGLILLSVFLKSYPRYQIIAASLLIQISFFLHVFLRPYDTITSYGLICNRLESISLLSLVMTLSTGLFFGTIDSGYQLGTFEDILIVILILINGGISLYFLIYFIRLGLKSTKNHLREYLDKNFKMNKIPFLLRCCNISQQNLQALRYWANDIDDEDYGISLKNNIEKEIFANYFKEKKNKLNILNEKFDGIKQRRLSVQLDKLRSNIQVMEKERCWQTIQNNRLYGTLKNIIMINKSKLSEEEQKDIKDIFKFYVNQGIHYNVKMNNLYMNELTGMIDSPRNIAITNEIIQQNSALLNHLSNNDISGNISGNIYENDISLNNTFIEINDYLYDSDTSDNGDAVFVDLNKDIII